MNPLDSTTHMQSVQTVDIQKMLQIDFENEEIQHLEESSQNDDELSPNSSLKIPEIIDFSKFNDIVVEDMQNDETHQKQKKNKKKLRLSSESESGSDSMHINFKDADFQNLFSGRALSDSSGK